MSALAGVAFVLLSCWLGVGSLFIAAMGCDDTCAGDRPPPGADWSDYSEAAQWAELGWLAGANVVLALVSAGLVMTGRRRAALVVVLIYGLAAVPLIGLLEQTNGSVIGLAWILASAAGLTMALSAARSPRREPDPAR